MRSLKAAVLLAVLCFCQSANAFSLFGQAAYPTSDNGTGTNSDSPVAITPPASMTNGMLVIVEVQAGGSGWTLTQTSTGGQTWSAGTNFSSGSLTTRSWWAVFNGTWSSNPSWGTSGSDGEALVIQMHVYSPCTGGTISSTPDVAEDTTEPGGISTVTITGQTPTASASVVTVATFEGFSTTGAAATWSSLSAGWTYRNGSHNQWRGNSVGANEYLSMSFADKIQSSASATGDVSNTNSGSQGDVHTHIQTFKETGCNSTPTFSSGPTYAKVDTNTIRATFTAASGSTAYCGLYVLGASTPTAGQVKNGTNAHGTNSAATTGSSQTVDIDTTDSPPFPGMDPYCILDNGAAFSSVPLTTSTCFDAPANFQFVNCPSGLTSLGTGSIPSAYNAAAIVTLGYDAQDVNFTAGRIVRGLTSGAWGIILSDSDSGSTGTLTIDKRSGTFQDNETLSDSGGGLAVANGAASNIADIATTDILEVPTVASPSGATLTPTNAGQLSYVAAGRQSAFNGLIYDKSAAAYMAIDMDVYFNNTAPSCTGGLHGLNLTETVAMTALDLHSFCSDPDIQPVTCGVVAGSLPSGLALDPDTCIVSGTPMTINMSGTAVDIAFLDDASESTIAQLSIVVQALITTVTIPNCLNQILNICRNLVLSPATLSEMTGCTDVTKFVYSQAPAVGQLANPNYTLMVFCR